MVSPHQLVAQLSQKPLKCCSGIYSIPHTDTELADLPTVKAMEGAQLPVSVASPCRSSSGHVHLFCYLDRRMSSEVNAKTSTPAAGTTSEPACALLSLQSAFRSSTRVVLATSLQVAQLQSCASFC